MYPPSGVVGTIVVVVVGVVVGALLGVAVGASLGVVVDWWQQRSIFFDNLSIIVVFSIVTLNTMAIKRPHAPRIMSKTSPLLFVVTSS